MNNDEMFVKVDQLLDELRRLIPLQIRNDKINEILNISAGMITADDLNNLKGQLDWASSKEPLITGGSTFYQENAETIKNVNEIIVEAINILGKYYDQNN